MAHSQDLSVARAIFIAALLRSEPGAPEISRDDATLFARSILRVCNICTASNIKVAKSFVLSYILGSSSRTSALAKYLLTLSKTFAPRDSNARVDTKTAGDEVEGLGRTADGGSQQPPEPAFKRLHLLYLLHDVLMHYHSHRSLFGGKSYLEVIEQLRPDISKLCELAVCGCGGDKNSTSTCPLVLELIAFWQKAGLFNTTHCEQMRSAVRAADGRDWNTTLDRLTNGSTNDPRMDQDDATKWLLPTHHSVPSDPTAPWHALPAANGLYLKRTSGSPLLASALPSGGFQLPAGGHEADPELKKDVSALYEDVLRCFDKYTPAEEVQDVDALGNVIWKDPERATVNYWGFRVDGVERRKEIAAKFARETGRNGGARFDGGYSEAGYDGGYRGNEAWERAPSFAAERGGGTGRGRAFPWRAGGRGGRRW